jgi:hypothetical protein
MIYVIFNIYFCVIIQSKMRMLKNSDTIFHFSFGSVFYFYSVTNLYNSKDKFIFYNVYWKPKSLICSKISVYHNLYFLVQDSNFCA